MRAFSLSILLLLSLSPAGRAASTEGTEGQGGVNAMNFASRAARTDLDETNDPDALFETAVQAWMEDRAEEGSPYLEKLAGLSSGDRLGGFDLWFWLHEMNRGSPKRRLAEFLERHRLAAGAGPFGRSEALKGLAVLRAQLGDPDEARKKAREAGYIHAWTLLGPTPMERTECQGRNPARGELNLQKPVRKNGRLHAWRDLGAAARFGVVRPGAGSDVKETESCVFAAAAVRSPKDADAVLRVSYNGALWAALKNGERVLPHRRDAHPEIETADLPVRLRRGFNRILVRASSDVPERWFFSVRITDPDGEPLELEARSDRESIAAAADLESADFQYAASPYLQLERKAGDPHAESTWRERFALAWMSAPMGGASTSGAEAKDSPEENETRQAALLLARATAADDPNQAARLLDLANEKQGDCVRCWTELAGLNWRRFGLMRNARSKLSRALDSNPKSPAALETLFDLALEENDAVAAWQALRKLESAVADPENHPTVLERRRRLMEMGLSPGGPAKTAKIFERELDFNAADPDRAAAWAEAALLSARDPVDFDRIREKLRFYFEANPHSAAIVRLIAAAWTAQDNLEKAAETLREAEAAFPEDLSLIEERGALLLEAGKLKEAKEAFESVLSIDETAPGMKAVIERLAEKIEMTEGGETR